MPQKFQHKRSSTPGVVPTTGQVSNGEIAINLADRTIYTNNGSAIVILGGTPAYTNTITTTGTSAQNIDTFAVASYRSSNYFYSAKDNNANAYQTGTINMIFDGTNTIMTEFGVITTNTAFITWTATANATHAILQATPTSSNTTIQINRNALAI